MKLWTSDWLGSATLRLEPLAVRGAYVELLCLSWEQDGLPNDRDALARLVGAGEPEAVHRALELFFHTADDGKLRNAKQEDVRGEQRERSERGKNAARKRWDATEHASGNASGNARRYAETYAKTYAKRDAPAHAAQKLRSSEEQKTQKHSAQTHQVPVTSSGIERVETQTRKKRARAKKPWVEQARELVAPIEPHRKAWEAWVEAQEGLPASRRATPSALKSHAKKLGEFGADAMGLVEFAIDTSARGFSPEMLRVHRERLAQGPRGGLLAGPGAKDGVPAKVRAQYAELHQARKAVFNPQKADWGELTSEQQRDFERLDGQIDEILRGYPQLARGVAS